MNSFALLLIHPAQFLHGFLYVHFFIQRRIKSLWPIDTVISFFKPHPDQEWIVIEKEFALPEQIAWLTDLFK